MDQIALERYFTAAREAGCPKEQIGLFASYGYVALKCMLPFHALARQIDNRIGVDEVLLDGTRGSAKSHAAIAQVALDDCQRQPGLKVLFLRQTQKAAGESFEDLVGRVLGGIKHKANSEKITFPNGSKIIIGGYKDEGDIDKYLGIEYDVIVIEECTQISGDKLDKLRGSLRTSKPNWVPRVYMTTNPGGVGHAYIKQRFIIPNRTNTQTFTRRFFSSYKDNPFINVEYKSYLDRLTGIMKKQWAEGDWDIFEGMAFASWDYNRHTCNPFEIPAHYIRLTGTDWGYANPFCTLWGAKNPDNGRIVIYNEVYEAGLTDPRQAETIKSAEGPDDKIRKRYADPSMWAKKSQTDNPTSTYEVYRDHGVFLTQAVNDRIAGKRKVDKLLENLPDGLPGLIVFRNCVNLIKHLPALIYSKTNPEDVDTDGDDHDYDALRYLLTDDRDPKPKAPVKPNPWTKQG